MTMIEHTVKFDSPLVGAFIDDGSSTEVAAAVLDSPEGEVVDAATENTDGALPVDQSAGDDFAIRDELLRDIANKVEALQSEQQQTIEQWQALAIRFAGIMTKQLIGNSDDLQTERLKTLIEQLIDRPESVVQIAVHPDDCPLVESCIASSDEINGQIKVVPDPAVQKGECRAVFEGHELISRLEEQLPDIEYRMMEALKDG